MKYNRFVKYYWLSSRIILTTSYLEKYVATALHTYLIRLVNFKQMRLLSYMIIMRFDLI